MVDIGYYHKDPEQIQQLVDELYANYPRITLPPEYAYFVENDLLRLLIRLARYKFVARLIKKTDHILEVGCGSGLGCMFLSQNCAQVTGIDVNKTEIEEAQAINRRSNAEFKLVDLFQLEDTQKYDVVVSLDVIEHMPVEQGHQLVKKMVSHLKPTGMLVIGTPSIYSYEYQSTASKASHVKCYDQEELLKVIETYCGRAIPFAMNDELVHTGYSKMAWYYFVLAFMPQLEN
ncbi:MAG: class I SAM-dependent methyltransferase [Oscillatoriales cyanobacterium]|uniref:class I SAM-dependent methyltransferase n=1 Tax=Microcoleus anatoxicus TaxID=2705319 RepID=UPI0030CA0263|nr:MAG: class I SAM-dependent methyltransferase [Oscillatoriales cyanobacterium]TAH21101.1 MAG: class I SAM-dependent methyltransferase [Oscillatoriales cyanobacterium]